MALAVGADHRGWAAAGPPRPAWTSNKKRLSLNEAGYQYYRQSHWNLAQEKFEQALAYNRLIDRRSGIASNLNNLGAIAQAQGNLDQAVRHFQEALAVNRELNDPAAICETLNNLGLAYQSQGRLREAQCRLPGSPGSGPAAAPGAAPGPDPDPPGGCGPGP